MNIVSLVPSLTELLFDLGLANQIVGRTKFCVHPSDRVPSIPKIGGTKNVNIQKVIQLNPDIIFANKEENTKSDINSLQESCNVHITEIANYDQAISTIEQIGIMLQVHEKATQLIEDINDAFANLDKVTYENKVCYLIWQKPYMTIGSDTYIHDMLDRCGYKNVFGGQTRYPQVSIEEIKKQTPDLIFLSSEPFPFKQMHIDALHKDLPNTKIVLVDGEYFSWYGSRMIEAADYFGRLSQELL